MEGYNPIAWVGSAGTTVPTPTTYKWVEEDVSASDAGRTEDAVMHKKLIGAATRVELTWKYPTLEQAATILEAFKNEYTTMNYLDARAGGFKTKVFYTGNRNGVLFNTSTGRWESISFNMISRGVE